MDWITAVAIVCIVIAITVTVVVLTAVGSIRHSLNEANLRQAQQIKRLTESIAALTAQQQAAQTRIQALGDANRRLSDELSALGERLADGDATRRTGGTARLLH